MSNIPAHCLAARATQHSCEWFPEGIVTSTDCKQDCKYILAVWQQPIRTSQHADDCCHECQVGQILLMQVGCYTNIHLGLKQVAVTPVCGNCSRTQIMCSKTMPEGCGLLSLSLTFSHTRRPIYGCRTPLNRSPIYQKKAKSSNMLDRIPSANRSGSVMGDGRCRPWSFHESWPF